MTRVDLRGRAASIAAVIVICASLTACGGSGAGSAAGSAASPGSQTPGAAAANPRGNVTLDWEPPTENADGSPLMDLKGYTVHYGSSSKIYSDTIQLANAGLTTYVVQNLAAGKYYFAVTAYNSAGQESSLSSEVVTQVD